MGPQHAPKKSVDIEKLLQWAYLDELPKRRTSSAEGIWDRLKQRCDLGTVVDTGHGADSDEAARV